MPRPVDYDTLADSFDRRRLLVGVQLCTLVVSGILTAATAFGEISPEVLLALTFLIGGGDVVWITVASLVIVLFAFVGGITTVAGALVAEDDGLVRGVDGVLHGGLLTRWSRVRQPLPAPAEAERQAAAHKQLFERGLIAGLDYRKLEDSAQEMATRLEIERKRLTFIEQSMAAQLSAQAAEIHVGGQPAAATTPTWHPCGSDVGRDVDVSGRDLTSHSAVESWRSHKELIHALAEPSLLGCCCVDVKLNLRKCFGEKQPNKLGSR